MPGAGRQVVFERVLAVVGKVLAVALECGLSLSPYALFNILGPDPGPAPVPPRKTIPYASLSVSARSRLIESES